ncbi:hypothetical protein QFC19_009119 [Naganishia cerealis]|uniref:Uncharacterized protein n=1 Tax=Naganishia cerealis TaxID=610337 RepID=A0ACC2UXF9_9TREE|nr:hypothetical protein QFC19_009119 [Naganishia cerealis]
MKLSYILNAAASTSTRAVSPEAHYLVISGVSRTFLPSDVEAALRDIGGSEQGAPRLVIKQPTVFAPLPMDYRNAPLPVTQTFHLTFHSAYALKTARLAIDRSPARLMGFSGKRHPAGSRSLNRIIVRAVEEDATRWLLSQAANEWINSRPKARASRKGQTVATITQEEHSAPESPVHDLDEPAPTSSPLSTTNYGEVSSLSEYLSILRWHNPAPFDATKRTIQVLLRGLPSVATEEHVRDIGRGFKIDDAYGVFKVPK